MSKEVLIKLGFILGTTQGLDGAAKKADQMAGSIKASGQTMTDSIIGTVDETNTKLSNIAKNQGDKKNKGGIVGALDAGLKEVAGGFGLFKWLGAAGMAGAAVGKLSSDVQMMNGGAMLRGQGISGMVTGIWDFLSGRGTREGLQDLKLQQQDHYVGQISQRMERMFERQNVERSTLFRPITEADPLRRSAIELNRVTANLRILNDDREKAGIKFAMERGEMANGRFMGMKVGAGGAFVDEVGNLKSRLAENQAAQRYTQQEMGLKQQQRDLTFQRIQSQNEGLRESRIGFGSMTPMEQAFAARSAERMKGGETLAPEEISAISRLGSVATDSLNKYLIEKSNTNGQFDRMAALIGDKDVSGAAQRTLNVGGTIEINLERRGDQAQKVFIEAQKKLQDELDIMQQRQQEIERILHNRVNIDRKLQIPGGR